MRCWSAWATRWTSPRSRPAAGRCTSTPATSSRPAALARRFVRVFDGRGGRLPLGLVRRAPARARASERGVRAVRVPGRPAGGRGRGRRLPAPRHLPPHLPLAAAAQGRRPPAAAAAGRARHRPRRAAGRRECCGFGGTFAVKNADTSTAMLTDKLRRVLDTARRGLRGGRQLVPHAHRRRAARQRPACARCTWPRSWRRPNEGLPGRRARARSPTPSCAATSARPPPRSAPSAPGGGRAARLGGAARGRRGDQGARAGHLPEQLERLEAAVTRAGGTVHWARDAAEANAIVAGIARDHGAREVVKVKSLATDEIGLNDALAAAGHRGDRDRPRRADRPARRTTAPRTSSCRRSTATAPRSASCSSARSPGERPRLGAEPLAEAARATCASGSSARRWRSAARTSAWPRRARSAWSSPRATAACARRCPRCWSRSWGSRRCCPSGATSRCCSSCCRAPRPASG